MDINQFDYSLPPELIGNHAIEPRDACKLMVIDRQAGKISHHIFNDLSQILGTDCCLVLNDTKVFPARLFGQKSTGGKAELLLLKQISTDTFQAIGKGRLYQGVVIDFGNGLSSEIISKLTEGEMEIKFNLSGLALLEKIDELGKTPLPPYIKSSDQESTIRRQYQTVYAKHRGSAAAPTAGLHFTPELISALETKGVQIEKLTLHVGLGTFRPVTDEQIVSGHLHFEQYSLSYDTAKRLNQAKASGKKIIAVGTTTCRVLESIADDHGILTARDGETDLFIQPGYRFKFVDGMITNFHLPKTSLLMLVSALVTYPNTQILFTDFKDTFVGRGYQEAIANNYSFFSFGDAQLIF